MFQQVILTGRLGADPDIRYLPDGMPVANMRVATDESYRNKDGDKIERTEWHRVVTFNKLANVAKDYMTKGRLIQVVGKLKTRKWDDKDGITRYTTEIQAHNIRMLDSAKKEDTQAPTGPNEDRHMFPDDDVPF